MNPHTPLNQEANFTNLYMTPKAAKPPTQPPPLKKLKKTNISEIDLNFLRLLTILTFQEQK